MRMVKVKPQPESLDGNWKNNIKWYEVIISPNKYHGLDGCFQVRCIDGKWYWVGQDEKR